MERLSSPHSHDDGIYFACTLAHHCGHTAPAAGLACLCCLGELEDTGSVTAGRGMAATAYVGLSLVWIGLGWTEQGRAGTSSGQKLNLSTWLSFKARTWGAGECVFIPISLFLPCRLILIYWNIFFFKSFHRKVLFLSTALYCQSEQQVSSPLDPLNILNQHILKNVNETQVWNTHQVLWTQTH